MKQERRSEIIEERSRTLRQWLELALQMAGLVAVFISMSAWVFGDVLGRKVVGPENRIVILERNDSIRSDSLLSVSRRVLKLEEGLSESLWIQCELLRTVSPSSILPSSCSKNKPKE
jgi:hypothetical protein